MITKILLAVVAILGGILIVAAFQPADLRVERRTTIAAAPAAVFAHVNDFHRWTAWSPWEKLDPAMVRTFGGSAAGSGATYAWAGNSDVGEGRMTITESRPGERVRIKLEFIKPFAATNETEFTFKPNGSQTDVTWVMTGRKNYLSKLFGVFVNMDKMIGGDFDKGLAALKALAEAPPKA